MEITLLKEEDIWGDNALQVVKDYGTAKGMSDLTIALGTMMGGSFYKDIEGVAIGLAWSASSSISEDVRVVNPSGSDSLYAPNTRKNAIFPSLPFSETSKIRPNNVRNLQLANGKTVQTCEYGEYPQTVVPKSVREELEALYQENGLKPIGKNYTFDSAGLNAYDTGFTPQNCAEYSFRGKKYIRIRGKPCGEYSVMSDSTQVRKGEPYWFEVQPIEWLMDPSGVWVAKKGLCAGIQFDTKKKYDGNFEQTFMHKYLQEHFAKEMQRSFTETLSRLAIRNRYFSNYVSGAGEDKDFFPNGKDGQPFTPEKARAITKITNESIFMRDLLKLIAAFPKEQQGQFKDEVLEVFNKERDERDQPNNIVILGKKLAVSGGYEKELNKMLGGTDNQTTSFASRFRKLFGGR